MDKEKMNARELTEKEMEQVSGGLEPRLVTCNLMYNEHPCGSFQKGQLSVCATCPKNN